MAASAADVRSILSLPGPSSTPTQPKKPPATSARKPEGISRELYSLIGPSAPSLAAQLAKPRLKQKPNFGGAGKVKWYAVSIFIFAVIGTCEMMFWMEGNGVLSRMVLGRTGCNSIIGSKPRRMPLLVRFIFPYSLRVNSYDA